MFAFTIHSLRSHGLDLFMSTVVCEYRVAKPAFSIWVGSAHRESGLTKPTLLGLGLEQDLTL